MNVGKHIIGISLQRRDWPNALANVNKLIPTNLSDDEQRAHLPYVKMVSGIVNIGSEKYYDAAKSFLDVGDLGVVQNYGDIASPNDIAIYGGLLALASMDRAELQDRVLNNSRFRTFLELEPHIRKAVSMFVNGRYSACLAILEMYRTDYLLDIHLQSHVATIYSQIRSKCIVQYFAPFSCVTLESMNSAFAKPGESLEAELVTMIRNGDLKARINTIDKVISYDSLTYCLARADLAACQLLVTVTDDPRVAMQTHGLEVARNYEKEALERIRRMSLAAADLEVKPTPRKGAGSTGALANISEDGWGEDVPRERKATDYLNVDHMH